MYEAKIIKDSICEGQRLTTMQLTHPRIVHSEFLTHCAFARNASSSRAIPFNVTVQKVTDDPFIPVWWGENQKGMQAAAEIAEWKKEKAIAKWLEARDVVVEIASHMASPTCITCHGRGSLKLEHKCTDCKGEGYEHGCSYSLKCYKCQGTGIRKEELVTCINCNGTGEGLNIHKQIVNRLLEPFSWITVACTGDWSAWSNYFALRCHPDAQPEIAKQAYMAQLEYFRSTPEELDKGDWHLPYIKDEEFAMISTDFVKKNVDKYIHSIEDLLDYQAKISVARCARTSYLTQEGTREFDKDIELFDRLHDHEPKHASPFEHVCQAMGNTERYAKYIGWRSYRFGMEREYITDFKPNHPELI